MTWQQLITASKSHLRHNPAASSVGYTPAAGSGDSPLAANPGPVTGIFSTGAEWMHHRLNELQPIITPPFNPNTDYTTYGLLKYGICLTASLGSLVALAILNPLLTPLSILAFYLAEIHFLFLFPILIDHAPDPILASIRATYRIGITKCLLTVIPIACYMLIGLLHKKDRLENWYIGCLAILIWYNNEIRPRI